jgi:general secretion pathway protein K
MTCVSSSSRCKRHRGNARREVGIALIVVAWFLALATLLAMSAVFLARGSAKSIANRANQVDAELAADSGIRRAVLGLLEQDPRDRWKPDGGEEALDYYGARVRISITDESGRIDINGADELLLTALFAGNGIDLYVAQTLADRIVDWRDADEQQQPLGAERSLYGARGLPHEPRDGPFETPGELRLVLDYPSEATALLSRAITTYTGQTGVYVQAAPPEVVAALEWADARQLGGRRWLAAAENAAPVDANTPVAGKIVRIRAVAKTPAATSRREAVLRITGDAHAPVIVFAWRNISSTEK